MAVSAPDFALVHLGQEALGRGAILGHLANRVGLDPDVVELEDQKVARPAINAASVEQPRLDEEKVAPNPRLAAIKQLRIGSPAGNPLVGAPAVTVDADDIALRQLLLQLVQVRTVRRHQRNVRNLLSTDMVELQDAALCHAAICTSTINQIGVDQVPGICDANALGGLDLFDVLSASLAKVVAKALATPPLVTAAVAIEGFDRKDLPAARARLRHSLMVALPTA